MSHWRNTERGAHRGSEQPWRSRGYGRGRGRSITSSPVSPVGGAAPPASRAKPPGTSSESAHHKGTQGPADAAANRRRMNLMASVSRSSGLEKDGDDLKNYKTQEEYRRFIQEKVDDISKKYPRSRSSPEPENEKRHRIDAQENVLILFRKLREGVASSARRDAFALEVYETSFYLSAIFESPKQTISIIPHLFPSRSESSSSPSPCTGTGAATCLPPPSMYSVLISLLHHLMRSYPSQSTYFQQLDSIPQTLLPRKSEVAKWLSTLTKSLRSRNYAKFSLLSQKSFVLSVLENSQKTDMEADLKDLSLTPTNRSDPEQGVEAVLCLLEALRKKAAETAWTIIRSAYRELACDQASVGTRTWLARSLCLEPVLMRSRDLTNDAAADAESWLQARVPAGHVRRKEGVEGRWIVCKVQVR